MKTVALLVIIVLGLAFTIRARSERSVIEMAANSLPAEHAALLRNVAVERQRAEMARASRAAIAVASPTEAPAASAVNSRKLSPEAALANNPMLLTEHQQTYRYVPDWWWGTMFRAVGFSPLQIEQWKEMLMEAGQRQFDLIAAVEKQGLDRKTDTYKTLEAEYKRVQRQREAEILGALEPKYREYQRTRATRDLAQWLARTSIYSDEPVTGEQIDRTARTLAANTKENRKTSDGTLPIVDWAAADGQLRDILSPTQIATLQTLGQQFEKIAIAAQRVDERTKELTAQFKAQPPAK